MILAHLTDLHIRPVGKPAYRVAETNKLFARAVDALLALEPRPDAVVVSGDLTDCGLVEEYEVLKAQIDRLPMPVHLVLGNHDRRETYLEVFGEPAGARAPEGFVGFDVDVAGVRLIGLDTVVAGASFGMLCETRLAHLDAMLAERPDMPTMVVMHHPPFGVGIAAFDEINLVADDALAFGALLRQYGHIRHLFFGHIHRPISGSWHGIPFSTLPATAHQSGLDFLTETDLFTHEAPGYGVVLITPEQVTVHISDFLYRGPQIDPASERL